ncbi:MAG: EAL domain-containing protein [Alphaproteobacteria bacterium]
MPNGGQPTQIDSAELAAALAAGDLSLAFQPKLGIARGDFVGVEALARWRHPRFGFIPPSTFIPLAEASGLINPLTEWVFTTASRQWNVWRQRGLTTNIAVNVSAKCLGRLDFPELVLEIYSRGGIPSANLTVEVTESATQHAIHLLDILTRFRIRGTRISLDDFGIGYSSLVQLQQQPFSEMKIDKSFVMQAHASKDCRIIVKTIIDLAHNLGLMVVAEGVETQPVLDLLGDYGCDVAQGYHIARPMTADALFDWVTARRGIAVADGVLSTVMS